MKNKPKKPDAYPPAPPTTWVFTEASMGPKVQAPPKTRSAS